MKKDKSDEIWLYTGWTLIITAGLIAITLGWYQQPEAISKNVFHTMFQLIAVWGFCYLIYGQYRNMKNIRSWNIQ